MLDLIIVAAIARISYNAFCLDVPTNSSISMPIRSGYFRTIAISFCICFCCDKGLRVNPSHYLFLIISVIEAWLLITDPMWGTGTGLTSNPQSVVNYFWPEFANVILIIIRLEMVCLIIGTKRPLRFSTEAYARVLTSMATNTGLWVTATIVLMV